VSTLTLSRPAAPPYWRRKLLTRDRMYSRLRELGIKVFDRFDPLRIGIRHDICDLLGDEFTPVEVSRFLSFHCRRFAYMSNVARGNPRVDLDGSAAGVPTVEERALAYKDLTTLFTWRGQRKEAAV
jgi:hypothetical protein